MFYLLLCANSWQTASITFAADGKSARCSIGAAGILISGVATRVTFRSILPLRSSCNAPISRLRIRQSDWPRVERSPCPQPALPARRPSSSSGFKPAQIEHSNVHSLIGELCSSFQRNMNSCTPCDDYRIAARAAQKRPAHVLYLIGEMDLSGRLIKAPGFKNNAGVRYGNGSAQKVISILRRCGNRNPQSRICARRASRLCECWAQEPGVAPC